MTPEPGLHQNTQRQPQLKRLLLYQLAIAFISSSLSCAVVPQNRRRYLTDRTMPNQDDPLERHALRKFHTTREAAAGGDGKPAGGGCGCAN
jgi:hypothetical protein